MALGAEPRESERRPSEKVGSLALRTLVPAAYGAALLAGLAPAGRGLTPWAGGLVVAFLCHFLWRIHAVVTGRQVSDVDRVEVGLLAVLALSTVFELVPAFGAGFQVDALGGLPLRAFAFGLLVVALCGAIPLPGLLAVPLATLLTHPTGPNWKAALAEHVPQVVGLEILAVVAGTVVAAEKRRCRRLQFRMDKLRLDAEHMSVRSEVSGPDGKGDLSRLDDVLYTYLEKVKETAGAHAAVLVAHKPGSDGFFVRELVSDSHSIWEEAGLTLDSSAFRWVSKNRKELRISQLGDSSQLGYYRGNVAVRSFLGVPIMNGDEVQGILALDSLRAQAFTETHVAMLQVAAHQVSTIFSQTLEYKRKRQEAEDFRCLHEFTRRMNDCSSKQEVLDLALHSINERLSPDFSAVIMEREKDLIAIEAVGSENWASLCDQVFRLDDGLAGWTIDNNRFLLYSDVRVQSRRPVFSPDLKLPDFEGLCVVPISVGSEVLGALCAGCLPGRSLGDSARMFCEILGQQVAQSLLHARDVERLKELASTDGLTSLTNRRAFLERFEEEVRRSRRYPQGLALLLLDVDHFKKINDKHGHPAGDEVLREVSKALRGFARDTDLVARYGGEEFALLLPGTDEPGARVVAERIRQGIEGRKVAWEGKGIAVKVSLGVTVLEGEKDSSEAMISRADRCLYEAKETGRNRVIAYGEMREYESWR